MLFQMIFVPTLALLILTFPFLSHPLAMGVCLLLIVVIMTLAVGVFYKTLWVSYAAVLILLGGVLVIFIYVALLASNEYFKKNKFFKMPFFISFLIMAMMMYTNTFNSETDLNNNMNLNSEIYNNNLSWLSDFYSMELMNLTLFLVIYLFVTLLVVVFNTKNNHGTLRSSS